MNVIVECQKFYTAKEYDERKSDLGVDDAGFAEAEGCVYFCWATMDGEKGVACFF